jgi:hypothetical protein
MKALATLALIGVLGLAAAAAAAELDAKKPLRCALGPASECDAAADCSDVPVAEIGLPEIVRIDFDARHLASPDDPRTSPISAVETLEKVIVLQGHQDGRGWTIVVDRATGQLAASLADIEGVFVLAGGCNAE